jgi:ribosomal protein S18 acetylase RimI-like enzyme
VAETSDAFPAQLALGLQARRVDLDADRDQVLDIVRAYDARYVQRPQQTPEEIVTDLASSGADLARDAWLVTDGDRAVGLGWFTVEDPDPQRPILWFDVYAVPDLPADAGLEGSLVQAMLARCREELDAGSATEVAVESGCLRGDDRTDAALRAAGFAHERTFWRMERSLRPAPQDPGNPPAGVAVRAAQDDEHDRALLHRLFDDSFAEHWGTVRRGDDEWWERLRALGLDSSQWWVADVDGEPAGFLMGDASRAADGGGYVRYVGVLEQARGRGIGRHLLRLAFAEHARRGWEWTQLTVDTGNVTGAPALYASVGMEPVEVIDLYRLVLTRSGASGGSGGSGGPTSPA